MPCRYEENESHERNKLTRKLDHLTRVCCDMRTVLRRANQERELTAESRKWIAKHDKEDKRRIAREEATGERERVRLAALDKLSLDERRVLGL